MSSPVMNFCRSTSSPERAHITRTSICERSETISLCPGGATNARRRDAGTPCIGGFSHAMRPVSASTCFHFACHPSAHYLGIAEPLIDVSSFTQSAQSVGQRVVGFGEGGFIGVGDLHSGNPEDPPRLLWAVPVDLVRPFLGHRLALGVPGDEFLEARFGDETVEGVV